MLAEVSVIAAAVVLGAVAYFAYVARRRLWGNIWTRLALALGWALVVIGAVGYPSLFWFAWLGLAIAYAVVLYDGLRHQEARARRALLEESRAEPKAPEAAGVVDSAADPRQLTPTSPPTPPTRRGPEPSNAGPAARDYADQETKVEQNESPPERERWSPPAWLRPKPRPMLPSGNPPWDEIAKWRAADTDPDTVVALTRLTRDARMGDAAAWHELADAFSKPIEFGTAGLRGPLGPGPARMNRLVVSRTAAALGNWLQGHGYGGGRVLIGYDARHKSPEFATDTAEILAAAGFGAILTEGPVPTPVVAFGVRKLGCVAGVMVTASHNPARDNGYKVYMADGCQLIAPTDAEIAAEVARVSAQLGDIPRSAGYERVGEELLTAYVDRAASLIPAVAPRYVEWVYTAMHGVGAALTERLARASGFPAPVIVDSQRQPDPDFPTVEFPNPEEPGALDEALAVARRSTADLILAHDPDADRLAVAVKVGAEWRPLSGDDVGALLADAALRRGERGTFAASVVSGTLLARMAAQHGQPYVSTLTGFKWLGRVPGLVFGYEEAIGYSCDPGVVRDKDGLTAALHVLALGAELKFRGETLWDRLDEIARRYGLHTTGQLSVRLDTPEEIAAVMARVRELRPKLIEGQRVVFRDLREGGDLPPTDAVEFSGESVRVVIRPSGTEPKLKCYYEVRLSPERSAEIAVARLVNQGRIARLRPELLALLGVEA